MITDFQGFGLEHWISFLIPCVIGFVFTIKGNGLSNAKDKRHINMLLALVIIGIRCVRYVMDIVYGRFDWFDLFSIHICHIDMIFLVICLFKPKTWLFQFNFLIGIPAGLIVALFPGTTHPEPGLLRAMFFIMSHMMLVVGALYLLIVEKMEVSGKGLIRYCMAGITGVGVVYLVNSLLGTNFLYIMEPPSGTLIETLDKMFSWPGYVFAIIGIALTAMFFMWLIAKALKAFIKRNFLGTRHSEAV